MTTPDDQPSHRPNGPPNGPPNADDTAPGEDTADTADTADMADTADTADTAEQTGDLSAVGDRDDSPLPFTDLRLPEPIPSAPPGGARWLAFGSILVGGLLGGMIGYGTADLLGGGLWAAFGALVGAGAGAVGVGVVAGLALRAMNEWNAVNHPEAQTGPRSSRAGRRQASRPGRRR